MTCNRDWQSRRDRRRAFRLDRGDTPGFALACLLGGAAVVAAVAWAVVGLIRDAVMMRGM